MADSQLCTILLVVACLLHLGNASRPHMEHALREHDDVPALTSAPWFCHDIDCPKYTVVNTSTDYEVRHYKASTWASTDVQAYATALASTVGFKRLYAYIGGANEEEVKIPMTSPVRVEVEAAAGPFCKNNFTVSFFVPFSYEGKPPAPNSTDVYIQHVPAFTAYVSQFGGYYMDDWSISKKAIALLEAIQRDHGAVEGDGYTFAGYDPPFRLQNRHNEIWIRAAEQV
uniref:Heme-binding protein 2 n=1 Tax=Auxenochlorella protothecoides TaxID=3075 RepID=A0A1D2A9T6_AUXPR